MSFLEVIVKVTKEAREYLLGFSGEDEIPPSYDDMEGYSDNILKHSPGFEDLVGHPDARWYVYYPYDDAPDAFPLERIREFIEAMAYYRLWDNGILWCINASLLRVCTAQTEDQIAFYHAFLKEFQEDPEDYDKAIKAGYEALAALRPDTEPLELAPEVQKAMQELMEELGVGL